MSSFFLSFLFFSFYFFLFTVNFLGTQNNTDMAEEHTLKEYASPSTEEPHAIIVYPTVEGNNFEIKPALIYLVRKNQFFGSPTENPNLLVSIFFKT